MKAKQFFTEEWGTGFHSATFQAEKGLVRMSLEDITDTMEKYAKLKIKEQKKK